MGGFGGANKKNKITMQQYIEIETTPYGENCVQVSQNVDYMPQMRSEARKYLEMLNKRFPFITEGMFKIKSCQHDFGTYLEIRILYVEGEESENMAYFIESNLPEFWNDTEIFLTYKTE